MFVLEEGQAVVEAREASASSAPATSSGSAPCSARTSNGLPGCGRGPNVRCLAIARPEIERLLAEDPRVASVSPSSRPEARRLGNPRHVGTIGQCSARLWKTWWPSSRAARRGIATAHRLAFHLLQRPTDEALRLVGGDQEVKERVRFCKSAAT